LQSFDYQTKDLIPFRDELIEELVIKVKDLPKNNFAVRQHIYYVDLLARKRRMLR